MLQVTIGGTAFHLSRAVKMQISSTDLKQLIESDQRAKDLFEQCRFGDCAMRCSEIAPKVYKHLPLSQIGIIAVYKNDLTLADQVLTALETASKVNRIIGVMVRFMGPGNQESYPDFGDPSIRAALTIPQPNGLGLTPQQAAPLLAAGEQPDRITGIDIEKLAGEVSI
jgi:hypothetical protein